MPDGGRVLILSAEEGLIEHMARGECVIGIMSDVAPPALMSGCYLVEDENQVEPEFVERVYARHLHEPWTIGIGQQVELRELTSADFDRLLRLDREYAEELLIPGHPGRGVISVLGFQSAETFSEEEGRERLSAYINQQYPFYELGLWGIIDRATGDLAGICGFSDTEDYGFTLGYHVAKAYRGRGIAVEAAKLAITFAVEWQEMPEVVCLIRPENTPSIHVAEALEMECVGEHGAFLLYRKTTIAPEEPVPLTKQMLSWFTKVAGKYFKKRR